MVINSDTWLLTSQIQTSIIQKVIKLHTCKRLCYNKAIAGKNIDKKF